MDAVCSESLKKRKKKRKKRAQMAKTPHGVVSEEQLLCPICLDVFTQPVTTPCGHNFCRSCLSSYWDSHPSTCPVCNEHFTRKPDLKVNTCIADLVTQFHSLHVAPERDAKSEVFCDICTESQKEAAKSCVECMASYCDVHLEPHRRVPGLKRHKLIQPQSDLDSHICQKHNQVLMLFCKDEKRLLCALCTSSHNTNHDTVALQKAYDDVMATLEHEEARVHTVLQDKIQKAAVFSQSIQQERDETKAVIANSTRALDAMITKLRKIHSQMVQKLQNEQEEENEQMESIVNHIQENISSFTVTEAKMKELKVIKNPLSFLQIYSALNPVSGSGVVSVSHKELKKTRKSVRTSLQTLMDRIDEELAMVPEYLVNVQKYWFGMILDPETAHPSLKVSRDLREVRWDVWMGAEPVLSLSPNRFMPNLFVLSASCVLEEGYFEVHVGKKTEWILGVTDGSVKRKGAIPRVRGCGIWGLWFKLGRFETFCCPGETVCLGDVERVGVYVHCKAGKILFYDVKSASLLYSFTGCNLPISLLAILNPCDNEFGNNLGPMRFVGEELE